MERVRPDASVPTFVVFHYSLTVGKRIVFIHSSNSQFRNHNHGGECMAKCKTCGTEAASPRKKWVMAGRADKTGKKTQLEIGLFDCTKCKKTFRATLSKKKI
jgi:hypothetical protein